MMSEYLWDSMWSTDFSPQSPNEASPTRLCWKTHRHIHTYMHIHAHSCDYGIFRVKLTIWLQGRAPHVATYCTWHLYCFVFTDWLSLTHNPQCAWHVCLHMHDGVCCINVKRHLINSCHGDSKTKQLGHHNSSLSASAQTPDLCFYYDAAVNVMK